MKYILKSFRKRDFTMISNEFLNDEEISFTAKGLGAYLLSKPDDWVINLNHIVKKFSMGKDTIKKYMGELISRGYVYKRRNIRFARKGEQAIFYYISDSKDKLYSDIISKDSCTENLSLTIEEVNTKDSIENNIGNNTENSIKNNTENNTENNTKNILSVDSKNKTECDPIKNSTELEPYLDNFLNTTTKAIFLRIAPNMSIEKFNDLYNRCLKEKKQGYARSLEACLILAIQNKWIFKSKEKETEEKEKIERILKTNLNYYEDLHKEAGMNAHDCIELFEKYCIRFGEENMKKYRAILEDRLFGLKEREPTDK